MNRISGVADELAMEVLSEAAETFFGQRKALEEETERFQRRLKQLADLGEKAVLAQNILHGILLDEPSIHAFYRALGLPMPNPVKRATREEIARHLLKPSAWTLRSRYHKLLLAGYTQVQAAVDKYLHGGFRDDPVDPKRKIAFFGYWKLKDIAKQLNHEAKKLNAEQSPTEVLQFVKRLDAQACAMEKAAGASCDMDMDSGMLYSCVDFEALCLPIFQDLPRPTEVKKKIKQFSKGMCAQRSSDIRNLCDELSRHWRAKQG